MSRQSALAYPSMWAVHLAVVLSVHFHQNAALIRLAYNINVLILVQAHAAAMHIVMPQIMLRCVHASLDLLEIRSPVVIPYPVSHFMSTNCPTSTDPFIWYLILAPPTQLLHEPVRDPCLPSPCGANAQCRRSNDQAVCSCLAGYFGVPPSCRPECTQSAECLPNSACINQRCVDPCPGSCAYNAICTVRNHVPSCQCPDGFIGDPFSFCQREPRKNNSTDDKSIVVNYFAILSIAKPVVPDDPCNPSPCGSNAQCQNGQCTCIAEYQGDPYVGCRPECVLNTDCPRDRACVRNKCINPCPGTCAPNAICDVLNHIAMCRCPDGMIGNAFIQCNTPPVQNQPPINPCAPSPCGPNSRCRVFNDNAVCTCIEDYVGTPPNCRPECTRNSDCLPSLACQQQHCIDPCPGTCGYNAICQVVNHAPICSCAPQYIGNPFLGCTPKPPQRDIIPVKQPCQPSPCGPYAECRTVGDQAQCSCLSNYIGQPPNCRPECVTNSECNFDQACVNQKCVNPCPGSCGSNAICHVLSHVAMCYCAPGYTGDPFTICRQEPRIQQEERIQPCYPDPCGANAVCRQEGNAGSCQCLPDYHGNPYEACRPECVTNSDCPSDKSCQQLKCRDPCPGVCGLNAACRVLNHLPTCHCLSNFVGDPYRYCQIPEKREFAVNPKSTSYMDFKTYFVL